MSERLSLEAILQHAQEDAKEHYQAEPNALHPAAWGKDPEWAAGFYARHWYDLGSDKLEEEPGEEYKSYVREFLRVYGELEEYDHLAYLEHVKQIAPDRYATLSRYKREKEWKEHFSYIDAYVFGYLSPSREKPLDLLKLQKLEMLLQVLASTNPYPIAQNAKSFPVLMDQMKTYLIEHNGESITEEGLKIYFFLEHLLHKCEADMLAGYMVRGNSHNIRRKHLTEAYQKLSDIRLLVSQCREVLEEEDRATEAEEQATQAPEK